MVSSPNLAGSLLPHKESLSTLVLYRPGAPIHDFDTLMGLTQQITSRNFFKALAHRIAGKLPKLQSISLRSHDVSEDELRQLERHIMLGGPMTMK